MDRRSFLGSLIGALAAAGFASAGLAAQPQKAAPAAPRRPESAPEIDAEALDKTEADYAQYYYYGPRRRYWRRPYYGYGPRFYGPRYYRPYPYYRPYGYRPYRRYYGPRYYW
ncbi:hypothetical protein [Bosea sp. NPDC055594]